jgi:DNA-directed RNA polymerase specialized sigma24 family protein
MPAPPRPPVPVLPEHRRLYEAVARLGRKALARYPLSDADRDEIIACYIAGAYRSWHTYRADKGTPAQWLLGILRNEARAFLRKRGRYTEGDHLWGELRDTSTLDPPAHLAKELLVTLTPVELRVVSMYEAEGYSFDEIALFEGRAKSHVHGIHARALQKMRKKAGTDPLLVLMAAHAAGRAPDPSAEASAQFWQGFMARYGAELGIQDPRQLFHGPEDDDPPESGVCRSGPSSRPPPGRSKKLRALSLVGALAGLLLAVPVVDANGRGQPPDAAASLPKAVAAPASAAESAIASTTEASPGVAPASPKPAPEPPRRAGPARDDPADREEALFDRGRSALGVLDFERAALAFAEQARRFPAGRHAARREQLWRQACAHRPAAGCSPSAH